MKKTVTFILFSAAFLAVYGSDRIPTFTVNGGFQHALHEQSFSAMRGPEIGYYPKGVLVSAGFGFSELSRRLFDRLTIDGRLRVYLPQNYTDELKERWHVYTLGFGPTFKKRMRFLKLDLSLFMGGMVQFGYMEITGNKIDSYCFLCGPEAEEQYEKGDKITYATRMGMAFDGKIQKMFEVGILEVGPFIMIGLNTPLDASDTWYPPLTFADISGGLSIAIKTKKASP